MTDGTGFEPLRRDNLSAFQAAPSVGATTSPWALAGGLICAAGLGVLVFVSLNASRQQADAREVVPSAPHAAVRVYEPVEQPEPPLQYEPENVGVPLALATPPSDPLSADARRLSPTLIIDLTEEDHPGGPNGGNPQAVSNAVAGDSLTGDERFAARFGSGRAAQARPLANPTMTVPQGVIITGVLETAINSDLPGYVRALVSRDVQAFSGGAVLIPRGSRVIGQYRASSELGQSRAFVIWVRLIRPDGVSIDLNSPGADALGRGGLDGDVDRHFFRRFGGAILLTLLGEAADAVADNGGAQVVVGVARSGGDAASAALSEEINIPPTISVAQGMPVRIFVARDLDFSGVGGRSP